MIEPISRGVLDPRLRGDDEGVRIDISTSLRAQRSNPCLGTMKEWNAYPVVVTRLVRNCALGRVTQYSRDVND